ncbi:MAG: HD-GYP domain-containing protein [Proteobacteria bacterium]|nr:HD-GYP domain-containing protein [Pseudomonadota bacterium]
MNIEKEKVSVKFLKIGMYICKLDRSWLDTPFPFQGFYLRTHNEIKEVQAFCEFVYIDVVKGKKVHQETEISKPSPLLKRNRDNKFKGRSRPLVVRHDYYNNELKPIRKEFGSAHDLMMDLRLAVEETSFNLRVGKRLDVKRTKQLAIKLVSSVIRNPNTLVWLTQLKQKGNYTYTHSLRSSVLATVFGRHLGLHETQLESLATGVLLADIGKTKISTKLLNKSDSFNSDEEQKIYRSHVELGVEMLAKDGNIDHNVLIIAETHHERFDGSGYPYGLVSNEIPGFGQIAGIVDTFDAMTSKKSYGKHITPSNAMEWLYKQRNRLFSANLVDEFIQAIGLYPAGSFVQLSDGSTGLVLSHNKLKRLKPEILLIKDADSNALEKPRFLDLSKKGLFSNRERPCVTGSVHADLIDVDTDMLITSFQEMNFVKKALFA